MAHPPPGQPAGTRAAGGNHAAAHQLHRKRALGPGPGHDRALGRVAGGAASESQHLLLAAGYAPAYPETRYGDPLLGPVRTALERILDGHLPYPAVIVDRHGDLVAANDGFDALTTGVAPELLAPPVSVARVLLHPQGMIGRLHQEMARNPSGRLEDLVTELEELVPDRPRQPGPDYLGFAVPLRLRSGDGELRLLTMLTHYGTAVDVAELRLEAFLPPDEATAAILTELAARRRGVGPRSATPHPG